MKMNFASVALTLPAIAILHLPSSNVLAQGTGFRYQGRLNDGPAPANGVYDLRFITYDNSVGGSQQGPILTNTAVSASNGLFTVTLDFGAVFPGADRFLEIAVRTNGSGAFVTLSPRQPLTPSPYAITAANLVGGGLAAGTYSNALTFNNTADAFSGTFSGNGAGVTNVNAATVGGLSSSSFWKSAGNAGTSGANFIGTSDNQPLTVRVNNQQAMQYAYASNAVSGFSPNVIGGINANGVAPGVVGATIGGGGLPGLLGPNVVSSDFGTVVGGAGNSASGRYAIAGGDVSIASGRYSVAFGQVSQAQGDFSVAMGNSTAAGLYSTAFGQSKATNNFATAFGLSFAAGNGGTAMGEWCSANGGTSVAMGYGCQTWGSSSFAAGTYATASNDWSFVWGDYSTESVYAYTTAPHQFLIFAEGGVGINTNAPAAALHVVSPSGAPEFQITQQNPGDYTRLRMNVGSFPSWEMDVSPGSTPSLGFWNSTLRMSIDYSGNVSANSFNGTSDRNAKENFAPVNAGEMLDKVAALPIARWNFKDDPAVVHVGPMAQDFHAAFHVGTDDKHIATVDAEGVALAAIQGLNEKMQTGRREAEAKLAEADARIQKLESENAHLRARLDSLENRFSDPK